ncbi:zinc finger protein 579 [Alligator mississippiensis]|nr:zinc finger protein 579 [Alligator mississippiensis]
MEAEPPTSPPPTGPPVPEPPAPSVPLPPHQCTLCPRRFARPHGLRQHRRRHHDAPGPPAGTECGHQCQVCGKRFKFPYYLARHRLTHGGHTPFQCPLCPKAFRRPAHLTRHERTHARQHPPRTQVRHQGEGQVPPAGVDTEEEEKQVLLQEDWTLLCLACHEAFETKGELKAHRCFKAQGQAGLGLGVPGSRPHQCDVCHKSFARPWSLSRHALVHTGEKPFACPDCDMTFRLPSYLKQHSRVHRAAPTATAGGLPQRCSCAPKGSQQMGELALRGPEEEESVARELEGPRKTHTCGVCGKAFKSRYDLGTHKLIHTGELPYPCAQCGKRFRRPSHLTQHQVTHTGARPFQCVLCQREFKRLADLARHRQVHQGDRPHRCALCHKAFARAYSLLRHQRGHRSPPPASPTAFLSSSCFDSQDDSAFRAHHPNEEDEEDMDQGDMEGETARRESAGRL